MLKQSHSEIPWREMTPQERADHRAAENALRDAAVERAIEQTYRGWLDIIFAGKRSVTRATADRRLSAKRRAAP